MEGYLMNTRKVTRQYRLSRWAPLIKECKSSGMTVKAWCLENNVNEKQFYYWQRRVREELCSAVAHNTESFDAPTFVPLTTTENDCQPVTSLFQPDMVLGYGDMRVEISNSTSPQLLAEVMKVIGHVQ